MPFARQGEARAREKDMDAFDNPARNGMGPQRDGASADQSNQAAAGSELLAAAANVTAL